MKKFVCIVLLFLGGFVAADAQRYAVIDSHYILEKMPAYNQAQQKLDTIAKQWQDEIDARFQKVDRLYKSYNAEKVMLSEDLKKKRQDEIMQLEKEAQDLQKERFGYQGDLFDKRKELIKPIQDRVYNAVQKLAAQKMYDFILDKSTGMTVFYADPKLDQSDAVLKILGIKE